MQRRKKSISLPYNLCILLCTNCIFYKTSSHFGGEGAPGRYTAQSRKFTRIGVATAFVVRLGEVHGYGSDIWVVCIDERVVPLIASLCHLSNLFADCDIVRVGAEGALRIGNFDMGFPRLR